MIIDVHVAFLLASLSVLFGVTYTLGMFLDRQKKLVIERRKAGRVNDSDAIAFEA